MIVNGDNPIRSEEEDVLGRSRAATAFAKQVLSLDASEGLVVGVLGAWGAGKTSFVNLARKDLAPSTLAILDFNPWMFSGAEQLVGSFFIELSAQLRLRPELTEVGRDLEEYGETFAGLGWLPFIGAWIERGRSVTKLVGKMLKRRSEGASGRRVRIETALAKLGSPIVVVLDDIDRLSTSEIRDVFRLVRLTASFPNIIYIVAFDRKRVEQALSEQGVPGRDYLEKILQVAVDLPAVPDRLLRSQILRAIDGALAGVEKPGNFDEQLWPDVFVEIISPLIRNMRDVRRYTASIHGTLSALEGQAAVVDVLALEAIRVFVPSAFAELHGAVDGLTTTSSGFFGNGHENPALKAQIDGLLAASDGASPVVRALVERLFPAGARHLGGANYGGDSKAQWLRQRRVAHEEILRLYLERIVGEGLEAFSHAEVAWRLMGDREMFDGYLRALDADRLEDVIGSLEVYEEEFRDEHAVPATIVLLNLLPDLPRRPRGMTALDSRLVVTRVTYRLIRRLEDPEKIASAAREILPLVRSLSSKLELVSDLGYREGSGHRLVSETAAADFEKSWRDEVRSTSGQDLAKEHDLLRVLAVAKDQAEAGEVTAEIDDLPELTLALLRSARSETRSQTIGTRAVHRSPVLIWDALVDLLGDEATLKQRVVSLRESGICDDAELLELVDRYLGGWRPPPFGEK